MVTYLGHRALGIAAKAKKVLSYFKSHFHGYAPENCLQIMQMLGIILEEASVDSG